MTKKQKDVFLVIDREVLSRYNEFYFDKYPRRKKIPIPHPYHESINVWMIMRRPAMNHLKQKWKTFITWFAAEQGYANLHIDKCEITQIVFYPNNRPHDVDNSVPKFILDGLVESGMIKNDDSMHLKSLTLKCETDTENPRTELHIKILDKAE